MFFRASGLLWVLLLLFAGSAIEAAPTIGNYNSVTGDLAVYPNSNIERPVTTSVTQFVEYGSSAFASVAADFLKVPADSGVPAASPYSYSRNLPPVPGTILMVLSGFLCVSLVKDRKVWLAVLAGLLWAGQTGIQTLPQLVLRVSQRSRIEQQSSTYSYCIKDSYRLPSNTEDIQYIGLLRHLEGIPKVGNAFSSLSATIDVPIMSPLLKCMAFEFERFICFSPAFIFGNLPRGPPNLN